MYVLISWCYTRTLAHKSALTLLHLQVRKIDVEWSSDPDHSTITMDAVSEPSHN